MKSSGLEMAAKVLALAWVLALIGCGAAQAAEKLYKWEDAEGNVYFSDRPPEQDTAVEEIEVDAEISAERRREGAERLKSTQQALNEQRLDRYANDTERAELAQQRERQQADQQLRCVQARANLAVLEQRGPAFSVNDQGERVYIEDDERERRVADYRRKINENC